jgi:hypothetical protein
MIMVVRLPAGWSMASTEPILLLISIGALT